MDPCSVPVVGKKIVSCGGVFDLAVEQPQLFRKQPENKNKEKMKRVFGNAWNNVFPLYTRILWNNFRIKSVKIGVHC